jgi:hypothetical protein
VWRVVALAALDAMAAGRRYMWWHSRQEDADPAASVQIASTRAANLFCLALHDFCRVASVDVRRGWGRVGPDHKFLAVRDQKVVVTLPA